MFKKKECVAMLLAGGQGSRLYALTEKVAKPAVSFGGKYRIIDFPLSNCVNSGIDTVGVLTQYQPLVLNEYIGNGQPWDLDRTYGGVKILPPYQGKKKADWYSGTANAIYQNMNFINRYNPEYVLILSGDHIYQMQYDAMLAYHKQMNADCTIAVIDVPIEEASRFGIMSADEEGKIFKFAEKPKNPDSTLASMGIYIFNRDKLEKYLEDDENDPNSSKDFGKNIIPAMLAAGERMYAYPFSGYWKDVGTIDSLWEANMDLLRDDCTLSLSNKQRRVFSRTNAEPPQFIGEGAKVANSLVTEGCEIYGTVENSVLFGGVIVENGAHVKDSVVMSGVVVKKGATVDYSIIDSGATIGAGASVGKDKASAKGITVIGADLDIAAGTVVEDGAMVNDAYYEENLKGGNR
ncbi:MAG: glucose-1-phosphate adenylyltransferase [Ruminococcaceae bacterium]|nr:glucose-1-phosphate adenylyltransferase [Oscillospiraceae bacterium]